MASTVTQAALARSIRAWRDAGVPAEKLRIVHRRDGVAVEPIGEREQGCVEIRAIAGNDALDRELAEFEARKCLPAKDGIALVELETGESHGKEHAEGAAHGEAAHAFAANRIPRVHGLLPRGSREPPAPG